MGTVWKSSKKIRRVVLVVFACLVALGILLYSGVIWPNGIFVSSYAVRGIDISSYQHQIDWKSVAESGSYTFAYIKATEGTTYRDAYFQANWRETKANGILRGAYHFFIADESGAAQAQNYISMVPKETGMLPPMLDLEVTGKDSAAMLREVQIFLDTLTRYYGVKPLIYTDIARYTAYIKGHFEDYPLTIRDVITPIQWRSINRWTFWQYDDRGHVSGIFGYVDLDAFYGSREQLNLFAIHS